MNAHFKAETEKERERMLSAGMREIHPENLKSELAALGYSIRKEDCFNYANTGNEIPYLAKAVYIVSNASGKSFANTESPRDRLPELQAIRRSTFCFERGRIWEL